MMRILVQRRSGGLGDVISALPALDALRAKCPTARLDVALPPAYADLLRGRIAGVHVLTCDYRKFRPRWQHLLRSHYDRVIDLSGPHVRPGEDEPNRIEFFLQRCVPNARPHEVEVLPRFRVRPEEREWAQSWLKERGALPGSPIVCLHIKSAKAAKDWPLERFRELARRLAAHSIQVLALERSVRLGVEGITDAVGLTLAQAAALIAACDALVGPDSGPMHLAAAVGTPCVALFGPTDPGVVLKHYGATHRALRRPRVADIAVRDVRDEIERLLRVGDRPGVQCGKVLFISDKAYPPTLGGAEISMHHLLARLRDHGYQTETRLWRRHSTQDLGKLIRSVDPDWVFTQLRVAPDVVREAKRQGRRAAVFVCSLAEHVCGYHRDGLHACAETGGRADPATCSLGCLARRPEIEEQREMFRRADVISCNSEYTGRVIRRVFGHRRGAEPLSLVVQHPVVAEPDGNGVNRRQYLTIIRPSPGKGQAVFEGLVRRLADREFLVVGGRRMDLPWGRVAYLPSAVNMDEVYRATRVLLQPAVNVEAFGRTVAEAAAFGVPSVVSNQGGLPEALGPGGVAVDDFENGDAWVEAIGRVEASDEAYGARALEHSKKFRGIEAIVNALHRAERSRVVVECRDGTATGAARREGGPVTVMTDGFPGVRGAFTHLAAVVPFVTATHFDPDRSPPPGLCVLGGWRRDYPRYVRRHQRPDVAFALSWHSSWNQIEQSGEWGYLKDALELLRKGLLCRLFTSCRETAAILGRMRAGVEWLPDTVDTGITPPPRPDEAPSGRVDLFCTASPRKNLYPQLAALADTGATLHVNDSFRAADHEVAQALGVRVIRLRLPERDRYLRAIAGMTTGLQVSLAESFNYVAAEHMLLGVPVIVSRHVPCRPPGDRLVVDDEHSPSAIRERLLPLLRDVRRRDELGKMCREHILGIANEHNRIAADVLQRAAA